MHQALHVSPHCVYLSLIQHDERQEVCSYCSSTICFYNGHHPGTSSTSLSNPCYTCKDAFQLNNGQRVSPSRCQPLRNSEMESISCLVSSKIRVRYLSKSYWSTNCCTFIGCVFLSINKNLNIQLSKFCWTIEFWIYNCQNFVER